VVGPERHNKQSGPWNWWVNHTLQEEEIEANGSPRKCASSVKVYCWRQFIIHYCICYRMLVQTLPCLTQWQVLFQQFPSHFTSPIWTIFASCWDVLNLWTDKQAQNKLPEAAHSFTCRITKFTCKIYECLQK
jgi:hypothetical protein